MYDAVFPARNAERRSSTTSPRARTQVGAEFNPSARRRRFARGVQRPRVPSRPSLMTTSKPTSCGRVVDGPEPTDGSWDRGVPAGGGDRGDPPHRRRWLRPVLCHAGIAGTAIQTSTTAAPFSLRRISTPRRRAGRVLLALVRQHSPLNTTQDDVFVVEFSTNGGFSWLPLETVGPTGPNTNGGWVLKSINMFAVPGFSPTTQLKVRFTAGDLATGSIVEAGIDG